MSESSEMALLKALVDALGFDIESNVDWGERQETNPSATWLQQNGRYLDRDLHSNKAVSRLVCPIVTYKLIKRGEE